MAATPSKVGAPSKMPAAKPTIIAALKNGESQAMAARKAKVSPATLTSWLNRGQAEQDRIDSIEEAALAAGREPTPAESQPLASERDYLDFLNEVTEARDEFARTLLGYVTTNVKEPQNLGHAIKVLAKFDDRFREEPKRTEVSGPGGGAVEIEMRSDAELIALLDSLNADETDDEPE